MVRTISVKWEAATIHVTGENSEYAMPSHTKLPTGLRGGQEKDLHQSCVRGDVRAFPTPGNWKNIRAAFDRISRVGPNIVGGSSIGLLKKIPHHSCITYYVKL